MPSAEALILCGQRWYAPYFARWLSRDPIGYDGGANLYEYCGGNPVRAVDPSGLDAAADYEDSQLVEMYVLDGIPRAQAQQMVAQARAATRVRQWQGDVNAALAISTVFDIGPVLKLGQGLAKFVTAGLAARTAAKLAAEHAAATYKLFPDVVPKDLSEDLILREAKSCGDAADHIMQDKATGDPRLQGMNVIKMEYVHRGLNGVRAVHWFRDLDTGTDFGFKWK